MRPLVELKKPSAIESYRAFLDTKSKPDADPLAVDAARRLAALAK